MTTPAFHTAPENDYRSIRSAEAGPLPTVSIVIPAFERPDVLARTLSGVAALEYPSDLLQLAVIDDGSEADLKDVVERSELPFKCVYDRQEVMGYAAGAARNLGVERTTGEVVLFLDSDCLPAPDLVERHAEWHRRAVNVVVVGNRLDVDTGDIGVGEIPDRLAEIAADAEETSGSTFSGWRELLHRRSRTMLIGDTAYRACLSNNLSVRRALFEEVGGFSERFTTWGGEDTELGWRLWNAGAFIVPAPGAVALHQIQDDPPDAQERRMADRDRALGIVADLVPQQFYRKFPTPAATVPKVSWLVSIADAEEGRRQWREAALATYGDAEVILVGEPDATMPIAPATATATSLGEAVRRARGEVLAITDGRAEFTRTLLARAMNRFDDPRASAVRVGYRAGNRRVLRLEGLLDTDRHAGRDGAPFFGLIKRRELMKDPEVLAEPARAWSEALDRSRISLLVTDLVGVPEDAVSSVRTTPGPRDLKAAGLEEAARGARRAVRRPSPETVAEELPDDDRVSIDYVGFTEHQNLGDDAVFAAVRQLMPWARIERDATDPAMLMVGGGTLINGRGYYLTRIQRNDRPNIERAAFATGVRSPEFWGVTEPMDEWWSFFESAIHVSVRGPDSVRYLEELGYGGEVEIIGDPALSLVVPDDVEKVTGRVVISPVQTSGMLHGGDDHVVFEELANLIGRLRAEGRDVVLMSAFPADDRWALEIMRNAGEPDLPYVPGYDDLDASLELLASADLVVGERLHSVVLAAAVGTPFVALEYRPKVHDFAASIGREDVVVRTDQMWRLDGVVELALGRSVVHAEETAAAVAALRQKQVDAAERIRGVLTV